MSKFRRSKGEGYTSNWGTFQVKFKKDPSEHVVKIGCLPVLADGTVDTENVVVISPDNIPDNLFEGRHILRLSEDKKTIISFKPVSGMHPARFIGFSHKENQPPMPKAKQSSFNDEDEYEVFTALYEITGGQYKGCTVSQELVYRFEVDPKSNPPLTKFKGYKGTRLEQLEEFLDIVIGDFDPPQWPDDGNILPFLQRGALKRDRKIVLVMKDGWIKTLELNGNGSTGGSNPPWKQEPDKE